MKPQQKSTDLGENMKRNNTWTKLDNLLFQKPRDNFD